ncbi:MAG: selenide, water dikinase SelD [Bacteroidales bacterium]
MDKIKLTSFSPGAGCGCKISPAVLKEILKSDFQPEGKIPLIPGFAGAEGLSGGLELLVGNETSDDAAVFDLGNGQAVISTTDFFMPICDDAYDFGRIASANAISDVYAMGGRPLMAISILGWPLEKLAVEEAQKVLAGSRAICREAGIPLAGGHSIDSLEPIFGLAVTGIVDIINLKKNNTAQEGDSIFLTKPLGVGILSTAEKKGLLQAEHEHIARNSMVMLNSAGYALGKFKEVNAMTDVTGFGLLGHLIEVSEGSGLSAILDFPSVPVFEQVFEYIKLGAIPGGTTRNWKSYGHKAAGISDISRTILCDPQTNGGLLFCGQEAELQKKFRDINLKAWKIGEMVGRSDAAVSVI